MYFRQHPAFQVIANIDKYRSNAINKKCTNPQLN